MLRQSARIVHTHCYLVKVLHDKTSGKKASCTPPPPPKKNQSGRNQIHFVAKKKSKRQPYLFAIFEEGVPVGQRRHLHGIVTVFHEEIRNRRGPSTGTEVVVGLLQGADLRQVRGQLIRLDRHCAGGPLGLAQPSTLVSTYLEKYIFF